MDLDRVPSRIPQSDSQVFIDDLNFEAELQHDEGGESSRSCVNEPISEPTVDEDALTEAEEEFSPPPIDNFNLVYVVCYLLGTSTLLPWYFFITCADYWMFRFRDLHNSTLSSYSHAFILPDVYETRSKLQADFMSYVSIASTIPSTIFLFVNLFFLNKFSIHGRVVLSFILLIALFVETTVLILFDTDNWQWWFFVVTLATVVFLNMATGLLQAALCGVVMQLPVRYISAFSSGQSLAGILAAVFRIWSLCVSVAPTTSTFMYFAFADLIILLSFCGYLATMKTKFFQFYNLHSSNDQYRRLHSSVDIPPLPIHYYDLQKKIIYPCGALFVCFVITTCIYPSVAVLVVSSNVPLTSPINEFFVPVVTYLLYSVCEYSGRVSAGVVQKPKASRAFLISVARLFFIPLLMVCNAQPRTHLPVLVRSDLLYATIVVALAFTNGYLANLSFVLMPRSVYSHEREVASSILVIWLALGLSVGSLTSFALVNFL